MLKTGWQTTEFWVTLGGNFAALVVALVALTGGSKEDGSTIGSAVNSAIVGLGAVVVNMVTVWSYIRNRTILKEQAAELKANERPVVILNGEGTQKP